MAYRPVNSLKHVIDTRGTATDVASITDIAFQHDDPLTSVANRIRVGAVVKAIFLRVDVAGRVPYSGTPNIYMLVFKNPGNQLAPPALSGVGISNVRKFVIHQEMMMLSGISTAGAGGGFQFPRTLFKGVIVIPKRYQRMGDNDKIQVSIGHDDATGTADWCIQCIYKEFF